MRRGNYWRSRDPVSQNRGKIPTPLDHMLFVLHIQVPEFHVAMVSKVANKKQKKQRV